MSVGQKLVVFAIGLAVIMAAGTVVEIVGPVYADHSSGLQKAIDNICDKGGGRDMACLQFCKFTPLAC
jgi:hypothetical protein